MAEQHDMILESPENEVPQSSDMNIIKKIFKNRFGHIRAGWRMLAYLILTIGIAAPVTLYLDSLRVAAGDPIDIVSIWKLIGDLSLITITILTAYIVLRWIDKRPFGLLGLSFTPGWFKELNIGLAMGFGIMTIMFLIFWITGINEVSAGAMNIDVVKTLLGMMVIFIFAGIIEEIITRGYLLQTLAEGSRQWIAMGVFSFLFTLAHLLNPNWSLAGAINIFLAGILLSVGYFKTRSLWLPNGLHMAWNWTQGPLWGMNVSGFDIPNTFMVSTPVGPEWLSGGAFGAEGSYLSSIAIAVLIWYIWKAEWIKPSEVNAALWDKYPEGFGLVKNRRWLK